VINNICDNALLYGYAAGVKTIGRGVIEEVVSALDMSQTDLVGSFSSEITERSSAEAV